MAKFIMFDRFIGSRLQNHVQKTIRSKSFYVSKTPKKIKQRNVAVACAFRCSKSCKISSCPAWAAWCTGAKPNGATSKSHSGWSNIRSSWAQHRMFLTQLWSCRVTEVKIPPTLGSFLGLNHQSFLKKHWNHKTISFSYGIVQEF